MTSTITQIACDLNEKVENRYSLVLQISELAKRLLDDNRMKAQQDPFGTTSKTSSEKVIYQALIMKSSEIDIGDGLIG